LLTQDKDTNILHQLKLDDLIERDFFPLKSVGTLKSLVDAFTVSNQYVYPVIDNDNNLLGAIYLENVKHLLFEKELYNQIKIIDITDTTIIPLDRNERMDSAIAKFETTNLGTIPVIDGTQYIGCISRSNIFSYYRRMLKQSASLF
jgi:CIC family chloride channel protein